MVEIVIGQNKHLYQAALDEMHQMRFRVVVGEWGWNVPGIADGYDKDQFDTEKTIYFLELSKDRQTVVGCGRLNPTTEPHMLSEVFPDMCDLRGVMRSPKIYEFSRFVVDSRRLSRRDKLSAMGQIELTINEYCLSAGITHLTWLSYKGIYAHGCSIWDTKPLGLPKHFVDDDATYIAAISTMNDSGIRRIRAQYRFDAPQTALAVTRLHHDELQNKERVLT